MDETILHSIINTITAQQQAVLITILRTEGSTPRDVGTQMLVVETGQTVGTIGGGTAEKEITKKAITLLTAGSEFNAQIHPIAINQETVTENLAVCGANMDVLLEPVQEKAFWQYALDIQTKGKDAVIVTSLLSPYQKSVFDCQGTFLAGRPQPKFVLPPKKLQRICSSQNSEVISLNEESNWLVEPILKTERLLILGAGYVAREVASHAKSLDFQVTVIDDRAAFAVPEFFPGIQSVICSDFTSGIRNYKPDPNTYVVIATWSHKTDAECLRDVLRFPAKYVGMLGSSKKIATIKKFLQDNGYSPEDIAQVNAPVGLDINAQTPSEIAISILAQIISVRRSGQA